MILPLLLVAACANIHDHDLRMLCEAEANHDASYCAAIRDHDLRALCLARAGRGSGEFRRAHQSTVADLTGVVLDMSGKSRWHEHRNRP